MSFIRALLDRVALVGGVIAGGTTPSFIAQYRQRLGGRLDQVLEDLAPFQQIADRFHDGSLQALIQYHLKSPDRTFYAEGAAIQAMVDTAERLKAAYHALEGSLAHQLTWLATHADPEIVRATWEIYQPSFVISVESILFAGLFGLLVWSIFLGAWFGIAALAPGRALKVGRRSR